MKTEIFYLIKHMKYCRYSDKTIKLYVHQVQMFMEYFQDMNPASIPEEQIRNYMYYNVFNKKRSYSFQNIMINALKLFFISIIHRDLNEEIFVRPLKTKYLPTVLSKSEIKLILESIKNLKHRTIISTIYGCGLRISEAINLTIRDIDSARMIIYIRQSKGKKDRIVPLSTELLQLLRTYWMAYKPAYYLFEGEHANPYSQSSIGNIIERAIKFNKINKQVTAHTLRHSYATHLMEAGVNLRYIQSILGHSNIRTTEIYTHVSTLNIHNVYSPISEIFCE